MVWPNARLRNAIPHPEEASQKLQHHPTEDSNKEYLRMDREF